MWVLTLLHPAALQVYAAVVRHVDWGVIKCLVIAGPGFAKDSFRDYLNAEAVRKDTRYGPTPGRACYFAAFVPSSSGRQGVPLLYGVSSVRAQSIKSESVWSRKSAQCV